jgi:Zn finger protein HypA/HybF involved in hydrogenase expression
MRITALRQLSKPPAQRVASAAEASLPARPADVVRPRMARCECRSCGAHCNAIAAIDVHASCPNCGASRLVPLEGASLILSS